MERELLSVTVLIRSYKFTMAFVLHDHRPLLQVSRFGSDELDVQLYDLERLQTEHSLYLLLHNL